MTDYYPPEWRRDIRLKDGFTYYMRKPEKTTEKIIKNFKNKITDCHIYQRPHPYGKGVYYGWLKFAEELQLYDAMEAGLIPTHKKRVVE